MSTETHAKNALHESIESHVKAAQAKLDTLKARAASVKASAELVKAIADLMVKKRLVDTMVAEMKKAVGAKADQAKADIESRVAELEKSIKAIEAKLAA